MKKRNISIDRFRGVIIILMILFQLLSNYNVFGLLGRLAIHCSDSFGIDEITINGIYFLPNMTLADIISPAFMLAIALNFVPAYNRRVKKYGKKKATNMFYDRFLTLVGIGMLLAAVTIVINDEIVYCFDYVLSIGLGFFVLFISILGIFKLLKKNTDKIKKLVKYSIYFEGLYGIFMTLLYFIFMVLGLTDYDFGNWVTLQMIGLSGIIATFVMSRLKDNSTRNRFIAGITIMLLFTLFHEGTLPTLNKYSTITNNMQLVDNTPDGGIMGAFAYSGLLLVFTSFSDIYYKDKKKFILYSLLTIIPTIIVILIASKTFTPWISGDGLIAPGISKFLSINKRSISPSYLVISITISLFMFNLADYYVDKNLKTTIIHGLIYSLLFIIFYVLNIIPMYIFLMILIIYLITHIISILFKYDLFSSVGKNPILMFLLEFGLIGGFESVVDLGSATLIEGIIEVVLLMLILLIICHILDKKNKIIKIG